MKIHGLKCEEKYYDDVEKGLKTFEVRKNDRYFKVGDIIILKKIKNGIDTKERLRTKITYILQDERFCKKGYVILGLSKTITIEIK